MSNLPPKDQFEANPFASPSQIGQYPAQQHPNSGGDATGGLIPYKNVPALVSYYLGIASLLPCIGFAFAIPALILGIMGLKKRKANPEVKGSVHAWIGIVLGGIFMLIWGAVIVFTVVGMFNLP